jgi:ubiquinone/menaquinone biosynthesis C-methylase UbiE
MSPLLEHINELKVAEAFSRQSAGFDREYAENPVIIYKRKRVREHILQFLPSQSRILEINSGTGEDAIFFAGKGHHVHATDISQGMQSVLVEKLKAAGLEKQITSENCSFLQLQQLKNKGPYDLVFSNFGGLNCTGDLDKVLSSLQALLKPGGRVCLVIIPPFCLWESLLFFNGEFKLATRRFFNKNGVSAHIEGKVFTCWYYKPSYVMKHLKKHFNLLNFEGLCTIVPPSYKNSFPVKHPGLFKWLIALENKWKSSWPWKYVGDYFIISFQKK